MKLGFGLTETDAFLAQYSEALEKIADVSHRIYLLFHSLSDKAAATRPANHRDIILSSVEVGESTSKAVGSLITASQILPAIALARVRLEQLIVASYLIHESPGLGIIPYAAFAPITEYRIARAAVADETLAPHTQRKIQLDDIKAKAFIAQADIIPGFDFDGGKLQPKWTKLDLYAMARARDDLAAESDFSVSRIFPLAALYNSLYKAASSVVHADGSALIPPFCGMLKLPNGSLVEASAFWRLSLPYYLVTFDMLQCYEALHWNSVTCEAEFVSLALELQ